MKKILLFRTIRSEEMGYVVDDIIKKYGSNIDITIITRREYSEPMKSIPGVIDVIIFSGNIFEVSKKYKNEIDSLKKNKFEVAIIPTNGNLVIYDNVVKFCKSVFTKKNIYYYMYKDNFILYKKFFFVDIVKLFFKFFSKIISVPITLVYFIIIILTRSFHLIFDNKKIKSV